MLKIKRIIALFSFVVKYKIVLIIYDGLIFFRIKTNVGFGLHIDALTLDGEGGAGGDGWWDVLEIGGFKGGWDDVEGAKLESS